MRTRAATVALASLALGACALVPALPASAKQTPFNTKALKNSIARSKNLTYQAQYTSISGGQSNTITIAQAPPKTLFETSSGTVVNTGKDTYYCSTGAGSGNSGNGNSGNSGNSGTGTSTPTCVSTSMTNPLLGVMNAFSLQVVANALSTTASGLVARALGIKLTYSSAKYAGQTSSCVSISRKGQSVKYCVTQQGVLSYSGTSSTDYIQLTKFSSKAPASLFVLPSGATVETLPTGTGSSG